MQEASWIAICASGSDCTRDGIERREGRRPTGLEQLDSLLLAASAFLFVLCQSLTLIAGAKVYYLRGLFEKKRGA